MSGVDINDQMILIIVYNFFNMVFRSASGAFQLDWKFINVVVCYFRFYLQLEIIESNIVKFLPKYKN